MHRDKSSRSLRQQVVADLLVRELVVEVVAAVADAGAGAVRGGAQGVAVAGVHLLAGRLVLPVILVWTHNIQCLQCRVIQG